MIKLKNRALRDYFFAGIFILLLAGTYVSYSRFRDLVSANDRVTHTNIVKSKLQELNSDIASSESLQRGYLLTGNNSYLARYRATQNKSVVVANQIKKLTEDNPSQQKNSDTLGRLLGDRISHLSRVIQAYDSEAGLDTGLIDDGQVKMDVLRHTVSKMTAEEDSLLVIRTANKKRYESVSPLFTLVFSLVALLIVMLAFRKIRKDSARLNKFNRSLESNNRELVTTKNFLQRMLDSSVDMVSSIDVDLKYTSVNKRSKDFIGMEPEDMVGKSLTELFPDFEGSVSHEKMLQALRGEAVHIDLMRGTTKPDRFYDVFFIPLFDKKKVSGLLVISRDVTALVHSNESLKSKNEELEKSNAELASFNYVASHDLQEPLRKIQIFTDRILDEANDELSASTKKHFERITSAALRMRKLIGALLSYSLANRGDIVFEKTDLNKVVDEAREQVSVEDTQKQLTIHAADLPALDIIPLQFLQLLINLFGNSLKYKKDNVDAVINLSGKEVKGEEIDDERAGSGTRFYEITIADNGIGFEPAYSAKIFGLFQRLHTKSQYSGTGIGLAICRKIAENHGGFINAEGRLNEGATFRIYLPL